MRDELNEGSSRIGTSMSTAASAPSDTPISVLSDRVVHDFPTMIFTTLHVTW